MCQLLFVFVIDIKTVNCNDCFLKLLPLAREPLHVAAFHLTAAGAGDGAGIGIVVGIAVATAAAAAPVLGS